ncbi:MULTISPECIES: PTS sugar transporter subunit IIA [Heyndrickxia]|jgi:PTS system glucose-specific IIA component|uniref:PTS glucose transporter subunit IIA n=1 Tax=Heyndrickxia oleronia TaxID=38875 RepID=A0A8E2I8K5_9BACI|nr:PTS glucose transporter subunit IIA [Heyndrickxia oleronia]NYV63632.1 PTS glucose transporter subunit IIA [Bacillus sp. Gen3]OJH18390.1 PTS glucose transporter subunit IIA [Bacillus obstructivus]MBU5213390.1 PTS glucose transporter subunit IIA [Heyndrickxia oleronia]MCI1589954.1 PTS glucose transporter subunit IIA [Heyndrickxia oleronia]MCI1613420.1 PTS glucose transporter subunit IIA [Heyndrickxia oleronia]
MVFNFFKKEKEELQIYAPINGEIISIEEVPDPVFNQKMMGEGVAVIPTEGSICSPVDGTILQVAPTKHAVGILAKDGSEILIHIGLETVALKGEGFQVAVTTGDKVSKGQRLIDVDWEYIKLHAKSIITPIVITNSSHGDKQYIVTKEKEGIQGETVIITSSET